MPIIKRYANRKLYDTEAKQYVTLEGIADLLRHGEDVQVIDHTSGDDITALITAQAIFAEEKKSGGVLPGAVVSEIVQAGRQTLQQLRQSLGAHPQPEEEKLDAEIERRIHALVEAGELSAAEARRWLSKLLKQPPSPPVKLPVSDAELKRALKKRGVASHAEVQHLAEQVKALNAELARLGAREGTNGE
jgi:polyhydroxyalkanoate synthesis repressor PhaR